MDQKADIIKQLKIFKKTASKTTPLDRLIFFGSRVSGKFGKYSDIDLVVVSKKFKDLKFRKRPLLLYDYWTLDYPVDFLCYTPEEFKSMTSMTTIVREAVKEGIEI